MQIRSYPVIPDSLNACQMETKRVCCNSAQQSCQLLGLGQQFWKHHSTGMMQIQCQIFETLLWGFKLTLKNFSLEGENSVCYFYLTSSQGRATNLSSPTPMAYFLDRWPLSETGWDITEFPCHTDLAEKVCVHLFCELEQVIDVILKNPKHYFIIMICPGPFKTAQ